MIQYYVKAWKNGLPHLASRYDWLRFSDLESAITLAKRLEADKWNNITVVKEQ